MKKFLPVISLIIIFFISPCNAALPAIDNSAVLYDFNDMPINQLTDKISMRFITTSQFTVIQWTLKKGATLPPHSHLNEQVSRVDSGIIKDRVHNNFLLLRKDEY